MWLITICRDVDAFAAGAICLATKTPFSPICAPAGALPALADSATCFEINQDGEPFMLVDNSADRLLAIAFAK